MRNYHPGSSVLLPKETKWKFIKDSIGYMVNVANNVYNSSTDTWIVSSSAYKGHGVNVTPENFERTVVNFAVRHLVKDNWLVHIDEYHIPDVSWTVTKSFLKILLFSVFSVLVPIRQA